MFREVVCCIFCRRVFYGGGFRLSGLGAPGVSFFMEGGIAEAALPFPDSHLLQVFAIGYAKEYLPMLSFRKALSARSVCAWSVLALFCLSAPFAQAHGVHKRTSDAQIKKAPVVKKAPVEVRIQAQAPAGVQVQDNTLPGLIRRASGYHPAIKSAVSMEKAAERSLDAARWGYFPALTYSITRVDAEDSDPTYDGNKSVSAVGLTQPLWAGGAIKAGVSKAKSQLAVQQSFSAVRKRELALRVLDAYTAWYSNYRKKKIRTETKLEYQDLLARMERRVKNKRSSSSDLELVRGRLAQEEVLLNYAAIYGQNALTDLEELLGEKLDERALVDNVARDYGLRGLPAELVESVLSVDPTLRQLSAQTDVSKSAYTEVRARLYPKVDLRLEREWGSLSVDKEANAERGNDRLFLEVAGNFGAGLSTFSMMKQAKLEQQSAALEFETERSSALRDFYNDWARYQNLLQQQDALGAALESAKKVRVSWERQFKAGKRSWTDVMSAVREVSRLRADMADVVSDAMLLSWRLAVRVYGADGVLQRT